jgi:uncharacterized membrane protein (UPF0127 family)
MAPMHQIRMKLAAGGQPIDAYVARTREQRALGLMHRTSLEPDEGMLFVCDRAEVQRFWMKDTPLALSIAFLDEDGTILHVDDMEPHTLDTTTCPHPVRYVLEMPQGWFAERGVEVGERVEGPVFAVSAA